MNLLASLGRKLIGFFVDDAFLGGAIVVSVLVAAVCRGLLSGRPLIAGALLAGGCLLALTLSVARAAAGSRATPMSASAQGSSRPLRETGRRQAPE